MMARLRPLPRSGAGFAGAIASLRGRSRKGDAPSELNTSSIEVAGGQPPLDDLELWWLLRAARHHKGTARMKPAAPGRVQRARNLAGQDDLLPHLLRV